MKHNQRLRSKFLLIFCIEWYQNLLQFIKTTSVGSSPCGSPTLGNLGAELPQGWPTEVERKFIDVLKAIIEGGYMITDKTFTEILGNITTPDGITDHEIEFFKQFIKHSKIQVTNAEFQEILKE